MNIIWKSQHGGSTRHCALCRKSYLKYWNNLKKKPCPVCGKLISHGAKKCASCNWKEMWANGKIDVKKISASNKGKRNSIRTEFKKGLKPWNYGHGIRTTLARSIRQLEKYAVWKRKVSVHNKYTCQICGDVISKHHVDHFPVAFVNILKSNDIKSLIDAEKCKYLWDVDNGRVLCEKCHKDTPNWGLNYANN